MNLPYSDPSNPALPSPLFSDVTAVRGDHMRANNAAIFANFDFLIDLLNEFFTDSDQLTVDEILEKTTGAGVTIDGVVCKDGVVTGDLTGNADTATQADGIKETGAGAGTVHKKIIEIGNWNMKSTASITVDHGLTFSKIRNVSVNIIRDDALAIYPITVPNTDGYSAGNFIVFTTNVYLSCRTGGIFQIGDQFSATSYNRGWIVIEYVD
jgi:hypothetical protein